MELYSPSKVSQKESSGESSEFAFEQICYSAENAKGERKQILDSITGSCKSGEVFAILGPSGAGKTSLLNVLTLNAYGVKAQITGKCTLNSHLMTTEVFRKHCCIVPQEDTHRAFLTCRQTMMYAASFYINDSEEEKGRRVDELLAKLGLEGCADTMVGNAFLQGLSGGQKKRLSIGLALLKSPSVLILDEPTSGLDAAASYHVMKYIRELASSLNIVVVCTIHQPASVIYNAFHKVLLLSKGCTAYLGTPEYSIDYFEKIGYQCPPNTNPAEFLLDIINSEFTSMEQVESILDKWVVNEAKEMKSMNIGVGVSSELPISEMAELTFNQQFYFVGVRQVALIFWDPMLYLGRAVMFLFACTFFSIIYIKCRDREQDQVLNRLWLTVWFTGVPCCLAVIGVYAFNEEFKTLTKEVKNGMFNIWAFLIVTFVLQIPIMCVLALFIDAIPGFAIANFYPPHFIQITAMYACVLFTFESIARTLSVAFDNPLLGMLNFINYWFAAFLFAGFLIPEEDVVWPFRAFFWVLPLKWSVRSINYLNEIDETYAGADLCTSLGETGCYYHGNELPGWKCANEPSQLCYGRNGDQVLDSLGENYTIISSDNTTAMDFGIIIAIGVVFQFGYNFYASYKASKSSEIFYKEGITGIRATKNSADDLQKLVEEQ